MDSQIEAKWGDYPADVFPLMTKLKELIYQTAAELNNLSVDESLKWGELSYAVKGGSPIRIDWKASTPTQCYLFFHCQTQLVETYRELFEGVLEFQGNRAIVVQLNEPLPEHELIQCIRLAMNYHKVKHLPLLGA